MCYDTFNILMFIYMSDDLLPFSWVWGFIISLLGANLRRSLVALRNLSLSPPSIPLLDSPRAASDLYDKSMRRLKTGRRVKLARTSLFYIFSSISSPFFFIFLYIYFPKYNPYEYGSESKINGSCDTELCHKNKWVWSTLSEYTDFSLSDAATHPKLPRKREYVSFHYDLRRILKKRRLYTYTYIHI